jgi:hypothetical protein
MKTNHPVRYRGCTDVILGVVTDQWQTASVIACQVVFPPDVIARTVSQRLLQGKCYNYTPLAAKSHLVSKTLCGLAKKGRVEKRKIGKKCEYRLPVVVSSGLTVNS